jgi:D-lactate dehydrogenase
MILLEVISISPSWRKSPARLMLFPNVLLTGHQGFLTDTALKNIAGTTLRNLDCFAKGLTSGNELT